MGLRREARAPFVAAVAFALAACVPTPAALPAPSPSTAPATFVVPKPTEEPATLTGMAGASYAHPDIAREVQIFFELFYKARTLPPGGQFDVAALRGLVEGPYADYTLPLFEREIADARAGKLLQVSFTDLLVSLDFWVDQTNTAEAFATRTRVEVRAGGTPTRDTARYRFKLRRHVLGTDGVTWAAVDFVDPATNEWISVEQTISDATAATELLAFFNDFYAARTITPGHPLDYIHSELLVAGNYRAYTLPLLDRTRAEAESGALKEVRYSGISVKLQSWDPKASGHGGLASVAVTRTASVTRASGADPPETATYQFRVHRHIYDATPSWIAVDFYRPDVGRWVTEIAGATVILPESGHG